MRIIFMGTPQPAADILEQLVRTKHELVCVVTQPDRPQGRGQRVGSSPVKEVALKYALPVEQPEKVKVGSFISLLGSLRPDIIVVVAYGKILPKEILDLPKYGCLNLHASLLPKYRGAAPIQWALLNGEKETGITIMKLDEQLDTGDIFLQEKIRITANDDTITLSKKLFKLGGALLTKALRRTEQGKAKYVKQNEAAVTYAPLLAKESGEIDWRKSAAEIHNRIRALVPWPVAHTFFRGKLLKIYKSAIRNPQSAQGSATPGTIIEIVKNEGLIVATGEGNLLIAEVQAEGKKRISAFDFALGHDVKPGLVLPN